MKKILCVFFLSTITIMGVMAQQKTLTGKYNQKKVSVTYSDLGGANYKITSISIDGKSIETILKERDDLRNDKERLRVQINQQKKKAENLEKDLDNCRRGGVCDTAVLVDTINSIRNQLNKKTNDYNVLNERLKEKEQEFKALRELRNGLELDGQQAASELNSEIKSLRERIDMLLSGRDLNNDVVSFGALFGGDRIKNARVSTSPWNSDFVFVQQYELTYSHYFSKKSPFALKIGLGFSNLSGSASFDSAHDTLVGLIDDDGDTYDSRFVFRDVKEAVHIKYLDIPIMLHLGNSFTTLGVQAWCEIGLKASIKIGSSFSGSGTYSVQGYYPAYNVVVTDIPSAGFVTDSSLPYSSDADVNGFVLWGQIAAGLNIPIGKNLSFMLGVKGAYTLLPISKGDNSGDGRLYEVGKNSLLNGGATRIFLAGVELGLSYMF